MEGRRRPSRRERSARPGAAGRRDPSRMRDLRSAGDARPACPQRAFSQKLVPRQAGIAQPALRVQDPQLRCSTGWREPIPRHANLGPLPHHVSSQSDPRSAAQLQPQRSNLGKGTGQGGWKARRLKDEQLNAGSTGQSRQSAESLPKGRCRYRSPLQRLERQVQQQQVDGSILEEHRRHRQRLLERTRRQNDQPVEPDAPSHGLDWVQASGQIQIRHDPAGRLRLSHCLQRESGLAAGPIAVQGSGRGARQTAQPEDRIQGAKAGWYRPIRRDRQVARRIRQSFRIDVWSRPRRHRQRSQNLDSPRWESCAPARSRPAQALLEGRQSGLDTRGRGRHGIHDIRTDVLRVKAWATRRHLLSCPSAPPPRARAAAAQPR
jgi:hypothetical protein